MNETNLSPIQLMARNFQHWRQDAGGAGVEMLQYNRRNVVLAEHLAHDGSAITMWMFDGAGLSKWSQHCGFDSVSEFQLFAELNQQGVVFRVGTSLKDMLDGLRAKLKCEADDIVALFQKGCDARKQNSRALSTAKAYLDYEENGPPKQFDLIEIAVEAHGRYHRITSGGKSIAYDLRDEVFDTSHSFFSSLKYFGSKRYDNHWKSCPLCRTKLRLLAEDPEGMIVNQSTLKVRRLYTDFDCPQFANDGTRSFVEILAHIPTCDECSEKREVALNTLREILGETVDREQIHA